MTSRCLALCALVLAIAGCGGHDGATPSATETTQTSGPPQAAARALPDGFPAAIPVVGGGVITSKTIEVPGSSGGRVWNLSVTGIDAGAYDQAVHLLTDAAFTAVEFDEKWTRRHCDAESLLRNDADDGGGYVVHLCGGPDGPGYRLDYSVNAYPKAGWQPPMVPSPGPESTQPPR